MPSTPEEHLAQELFRTLYEAGVSFESNALIPLLTTAVRRAGFRYVPASEDPVYEYGVRDDKGRIWRKATAGARPGDVKIRRVPAGEWEDVDV